MVDKDDCVDMIGLGFFKAFDLAIDDILVKFIYMELTEHI